MSTAHLKVRQKSLRMHLRKFELKRFDEKVSSKIDMTCDKLVKNSLLIITFLKEWKMTTEFLTNIFQFLREQLIFSFLFFIKNHNADANIFKIK